MVLAVDAMNLGAVRAEQTGATLQITLNRPESRNAMSLQMVAEFLEPLVVDDATLGLDAIREVGPGGHFFGCEHTQARYRTAFYAPMVSDWRNFESWREAGSPSAAQHANKIVKDMLAAYEPPPLDPAIKDELDAFVARRTAEGGAPSEF